MVVLALVAAVLPRRKGPVELAALTAAVLVAFQIALTHWFYLYLPVGSPRSSSSGYSSRARSRSLRVRNSHRTDRTRPAGLGVAVDQHALDLDAALRGLEAHREARCQIARRQLGHDPDHGIVRARHAGVGDVRRPDRQEARVGGLDVRVRPDDRQTCPSSQSPSAIFSLVASAWTFTRKRGVSRVACATRSSMTSNMDVWGRRKSEAWDVDHREPGAVPERDDREASPGLGTDELFAGRTTRSQN